MTRRTVLATVRPIRETKADRGVCSRCGIERRIRPDRPNADLCADCLYVIRYREGKS